MKHWGQPTLVLVLLAGCSQIFGLGPPVVGSDIDAAPGVDNDRDGIDDSIDNCDQYNPDQADVDANQLGDVCEGCVVLPFTATQDDDGDGTPDLVDNCIGYITAQPDTDGDGVGNACDQHDLKDVRFCVWTFRDPETNEDPAVWTTSWVLGNTWHITDSKLVHESAAQLDTATLRNVVFNAPGGIAFDARMHLESYTSPMVLGVAFELQMTTATLYTCQAVQTASSTTSEFQLLKDGVVEKTYAIPLMIPQNIDSYVRFSAYKVSGGMRVSCVVEIDQLGGGSLELDEPLPPEIWLRPRLIGDRANAAFDHVTIYKLGI